MRCRWCERAYCEDCLEWERAQLLDDTLPELLALCDYVSKQAYYIECPECCELERVDDGVRAERARMRAVHDAALQQAEEDDAVAKAAVRAAAAPIAAVAVASVKEEGPPSRSGSMTDALTIDESGVATPSTGPFTLYPVTMFKAEV